MNASLIRRVVVLLAFAAGALAPSRAEPAPVWQWSVPVASVSSPEGRPDARAYLWIPPDCARVRGVVVANHNMIEQGILEHRVMRATLAELGFAELWIVPAMDATFDFNQGAGERFQRIVDAVAAESGYAELGSAPVVPLGHSACATFPWNFAAWNPGRTLAILSVHGDAPQTTLTGNGRPRIAWGDRNIDGVPGLMAMGEYEWSEDRIEPAFAFMQKHPEAPLTLFGDAGQGHYEFGDRLVEFLALFIKKAAAARLPAEAPLHGPVALRAVDPRAGWRMDRWRRDQPAVAPAAPFDRYEGDPRTAFWCFDEETARTIEAHYARARGKAPQLLSITDPAAADPLSGSGEPVSPRFVPEADGITFRLRTAFMPVVPGSEKTNTNAARWAYLPPGAALGHATGGGPVVLSKIVGPAVQLAPDTFRLAFGRAEDVPNPRNQDIWIVGSHPGDERFKGIVQQAVVRVPRNDTGVEQTLAFPAIADQAATVKAITLTATSSAGAPVSYYVREGPAEVAGNTLTFTAIPPRSRFPLKVTVVAWQWGHASSPALRTATPVARTFYLHR